MYGAGSLGLCALAILRALYPDVAVAVVARFPAQAELAWRFGAAKVVAHEPRLAIIEELVSWRSTVSAGTPLPTTSTW